MVSKVAKMMEHNQIKQIQCQQALPYFHHFSTSFTHHTPNKVVLFL